MQRSLAQLLCSLCSSLTFAAAQSISDALEPVGELSELRNFLTGSPELISWLDSDTPITLLAPNNDAFKQLVGSVERDAAERLLVQHTLDGAYEDFEAVDSPMIRMARHPSLEDNKIRGGQLIMAQPQGFSNLTAFTSGMDQSVLTSVAEPTKFDSGFIYILDGHLTAPSSFSSSTSSRAATALSEARIGEATDSSTSQELDNLSNVTVFLPIDYVWERIGNVVEEWSRETLDRILSYHVIKGVVLPETVTKLPAAAELTTEEGTLVTISSVEKETFINNAKIIAVYPNIFQGGLIYSTFGVLNPDNTTLVTDEPNTSDVAFEGTVMTANFTFATAEQSETNTTSTAPSDGDTQSSSSSSNSSSTSLSTGAKAAIGVGVPAAVILIGVVCAYLLFKRRRSAGRRESMGGRASVDQPWGQEASTSQKDLLKPVTITVAK